MHDRRSPRWRRVGGGAEGTLVSGEVPKKIVFLWGKEQAIRIFNILFAMDVAMRWIYQS